MLLMFIQVSVKHYEVVWKGCEQTTWEPVWNLEGAKEVVEEFEEAWARSYNEVVPKPAAPAAIVVDGDREVVEAATATASTGKKRKFPLRSSVWDVFCDVGDGMLH